MKTGVDIAESLHYMLIMFGVPIDVSDHVFYNNKAIYKNTTTPESLLNNHHHSIVYHRCRSKMGDNTIRAANQCTGNNIVDIFTNIMILSRRSFLLEKFTY